MDSDKFAEWVANPKHKDDFVFLGDFGDASPAYTSPVIWELRKNPIIVDWMFIEPLIGIL